MESTAAKRKNKRVAILLCLLAAAAVLIAMWANRPQQTETLAEAGVPLSGIRMELDENAVEYGGETPADKTPEAAGIKIPGWGSITLAAGQEQADVTLLNPEGNPCYFTFDLILADTGETLYSSGLVPPGQCVEQAALSRALAEGEYAATVKIGTYSLETQSEMNGAEVSTTLRVLAQQRPALE